MKRPTFPVPVVPPTEAAREANSNSFFRLMCFVISFENQHARQEKEDKKMQEEKKTMEMLWIKDSDLNRGNTDCFI